jgi:16S rRNA (guanine527-N7)-methyltransferase
MERITHYFPELSKNQISAFESMQKLYVEWNDRINVVSRKDIQSFEVHHLLHALSIALIYPFKPGQKVLDVGTGGGLPGLPLALMYPDVDFTLVDSIGKKIKVVNEIAKHLNMKNVHGIHGRAESVEGLFDVITARAVTRLNPLFGFVHKKFRNKHSVMLCLKGGDLKEEIHEFSEMHPHWAVQSFELTDFYTEPFFETKKLLKLGKVRGK